MGWCLVVLWYCRTPLSSLSLCVWCLLAASVAKILEGTILPRPSLANVYSSLIAISHLSKSARSYCAIFIFFSDC
uniref:Putative secreted protein n=1 Tax=Anopheles triannulatus TaxID=58253 RepID=A0A2M4B756_9DIPT